MVKAAADYGEDPLVEQPAIAIFQELGWDTANVYNEVLGIGATLGRETRQEVVLVQRLRPALEKLNPLIPPESLNEAIEDLTRDRSVLSAVNANREVHDLLRDGKKVMVRDRNGAETSETVRFIDWNEPEANDFFLASQLWVQGEMYTRRPDLVGFVNGIPLVFIELKASHKGVEDAYKDNLTDYRDTIPQLFQFNGFLILSNGSETKVGSTTAGWEHFSDWKKINDEGEQGIISLDTVIRGTCAKRKLLDLIENFTLFEELKGATVKILAKNHQHLGVNRAIDAVREIKQRQGRLGVFWHTQGSGKSLSMVFFSQKILRKVPGNWTFVIVTDRDELDDQIYKTFAACGAVTEKEAQATCGERLRQLLTEDHRYVFTLIQKFHAEKGTRYPKLSDRDDVIVITDEAHRSQYDIFAANMRDALPHAAFLGFTGTPLMVGEEKTRDVFGDYISIYTYRQSVEDKATVPLFYENRIPELQLTNENLNEDMQRLLEDAELDEAQEKKLEREFAREYHLITRDERLEKVAEDIVAHFMGRGHMGKAMVVCIDKATAVRMYDKVRKYWQVYLDNLRAQAAGASAEDANTLVAKIRYMEETDMAVVVSQGQNEIEEMRSKGLDITPHRKRMVSDDLDTKFKKEDDPFRIVFVCAMWMTGFDVPCCSTIYLDKPMRNHTLMQTIARANRVAQNKVNGLIVDYVGIFRDLEKALAIYAAPRLGGGTDCPIQDKSALVELLRKAIEEVLAFCSERGIDPGRIQGVSGFERIKLLDDAVEAIVGNDERKRRYLQLAANVVNIFKAILPDPLAGEFAPICTLVAVIADKIRSLEAPADISGVMRQVEELLDRSIAAKGYLIAERPEEYEGKPLLDLTKLDFDALRERFKQGRKRTQIERLRAQLEEKIKAMVRLNRTRIDFLKRFQRLIDAYNAGSRNIEELFEELMNLLQSLDAEEKRGVAESLTEEELALFDILTKPDPTLTKKQKAEVKKIVRSLLETLKREKLVLDWRKRQQSRQAVRLCIEETLDTLPDAYTAEIYQTKCDLAYQHVYESYWGEGRGVYQPMAA
jgi:type I restriction enzyme, R subunit